MDAGPHSCRIKTPATALRKIVSMARGSVEVTYESPDKARIPDLLTEGAVLLMDLRQRGILGAVGDRLHIRRQGGCGGLDVWLALLLFLLTGTGRGIRAFREIIQPHVVQLAALAGRRRLLAPAGLSRALDAVEFGPAPRGIELAADRSGKGRSRPGSAGRTDLRCGARGWRVFDLDPTVATLRHRALPVEADLPSPRRRSEDTGAPGHSGPRAATSSSGVSPCCIPDQGCGSTPICRSATAKA